MNTILIAQFNVHRKKISGFSLIEVLIAVLVLCFGLLGMGLLQTMTMRSGQTANYRTQATNLAYEMLDMIRANKSEVGNYNTVDFANFTNASPTAATCTTALNNSGTGMRYAQDRQLWICDVRAALPQGEGNVTVTKPSSADKPTTVKIQLRWLEDKSKSDATAATRDSTDASVRANSQWTGAEDFSVTTSI